MSNTSRYMIKQGLHLTDYIKVYKTLSPELCDKVLKATETATWYKHEWHNQYKNVDSNNQTKQEKLVEENPRFTEGMDACRLDIMLESIVTNELIKSMGQYSLQVGPQFDNRPRQLVSGFNPLRINRYTEGVGMTKHDDQSYDKEHPLVTVIVMLNDDFEGGELILLDDYEVKLKAGEACYFPSNFMFPHQVKPVTKGVRLTVNAWSW
jgi:predicted 2-oxoglutarate/Fe(II)-dependent dioxygenase YbiX